MSCLYNIASSVWIKRDQALELKFYLAFGECSDAFMPKLPREVKGANIVHYRQTYALIREYLANRTHIKDWTRVIDEASTIDDITSVFASYIRHIPKFQQSWTLSSASLGTDGILMAEAVHKKRKCTEIISFLDQQITITPIVQSARNSSASQDTERGSSSRMTLTELLGNQSATPEYLWFEVLLMATLVENSQLRDKARSWIDGIKRDVGLDLTFPELTPGNLPAPPTCKTFRELVHELSLQFLEKKLGVSLKGNVRDTLISMFEKSEYCRIIVLETINNASIQRDILDNVNTCRDLLFRYKGLITEFVDSSIALPHPIVDCITRALFHCPEIPLPFLGFHKHLFWPLGQIAKAQGHVFPCEQHEIFFEDAANKILPIKGIERSLQTYVAAISCPFLIDALSYLPKEVLEKASLDRVTQYLQFARFFFPEDSLVFLKEETKTPVIKNRKHVLALVTMIQNNYEKFTTDVITLINLYGYLLCQTISLPLISHIKEDIFHSNWTVRKGGVPIDKSKCEKLLENYEQKGLHHAKIKELVFDELKKIPELTDRRSVLTYSKLTEMQIAIKDFLPKQVGPIHLCDILLAQQACIARLPVEEAVQRFKRFNALLNLEEEEEMQPALYFKVASSIIEHDDLLKIYSLVPRDKEQVPMIDTQLHFFAVIGLEGNIREQITNCLSYTTRYYYQRNSPGVQSFAEAEVHGMCLTILKRDYMEKARDPEDQLLVNQLITALT